MIDLCDKIITKYNISKITKLTKGFSRDKKYIIENCSYKYLLRISDISLYEKKSSQFKLLKKIESLDINCSKPIEFGKLNNDYCYMILSWLEGVDGKDGLQGMSDKDAYNLGIEAGIMLKRLHSIPIDDNNLASKSWWEKYQEKMGRKINSLLECEYKIPMQEDILKYYQDNCYLMKDRPQLFAHGDYHLGNMIVNNGKIGIIDFDKNNVTDPYDDLKPFCWNVMESEYFETGLINGYFDNNIPSDFFKLLKFYTAETIISHLPWAVQFGEEEIRVMEKVNDLQMIWWDNFKLDVPTWYKGIKLFEN